ncbi:uncharacterized protein LOC132936326 isoform X2 [Metopolophium dirhodum]|nr:uncharacterized protein LOC132936326 isoform X2 [Metopolophium dirhodum]
MCIATDCEPIDSDNSDKESIEQKDHLVALLFKFMDDRGTPINEAPVINEKDVDLYKLFKVVNSCGGYNKVNKHKLWELVAYKAGHEKESYFSVKHCYQQYLHHFEDFYRKLGCTMMSHSRGERSHSRFSRSIIRDIDKSLPSTSSATDKIKCAKNELNDTKNENSAVIKKTAKVIKTEEKRIKITEESSKKGDKKKEDIANSTPCNTLSVKWDHEITETKDPVRNSKTKREMVDILKMEIKKEKDSKAVNDDQIIKDVKLEKKIYTRNLFGKSMQKIIKKEKVEEEKSANTGLPGMRKIKGIKEQIKTDKEIITPIKKSKRRVSYTQQDASIEKLDDERSKFTQSKTKGEVPTKSRRVSVISNLGDSVTGIQLTQPGLLVENLIKIKKEDVSEKKKTGRKNKDDKEKVFSNDIILTPVNIENMPFDKNTPVVVGDNLVVYYGNKEAKTYDAKVISVCDIEGVKKYYVHYKGWNSRYDEWIDVMRIAYKTKDPEPGLEVDDADSSKSSPPEQKNVDLKKVSPTSSRTRISVTPLTPNSNVKKSHFSSAQSTRTCTLTDRPLYNIDSSDLEGECTLSEGSFKQYSKKKVIKSEPGVIIKTEPLDTDDQKKTEYPRTYPSKKKLMQQSAHLKPTSSVLKVHSNKFKEVDICKQVTLKQPFESPSYSIKPNTENENIEAQNENKIDGIQIELKIAPNHCLSPKVKSEKNDLEHFSESSKCENEEIRIESEPFIIPTKSEILSIIYYPLSSQDEELIQLNKVTDVISSSSDDKFGESKISGTYFDLNKIRSDMKGLMPVSTNSNNDIIKKTESFILDQKIEIEVPKMNEPVTDDEFKESESCNITISSVIEEKLCKSIIHDSPKLFNSKKPDKLQRVIDSSAQEEVVEQNKSMIPFVPNSNIIYSFDNNIKIKVNDNLNIINEIENPIMIKQSDNGSNEFQNLISEVMVNTPNIKEIGEHFQDVPDSQYEVLDLSMKPSESPSINNIFGMPEHYEPNDMIVEEEDDDEDYDESKLVIAENFNIETDYQKDSDVMVISKEHNSSDVQIDENIEAQSLALLRPYLHTNIEIDCKSSSQIKRDISIPKDTDNESTTFCTKSIQNDRIQRNYSSQNRPYMNNNYENTKSGFEFYSNSKTPLIEVTENVTEFPINNKHKKCDFEVENVKDKYNKEKTMVLPELRCREEIVDEDTPNNILNIEYNSKYAEYDIHKPSTSKGFFDSIYQPGTSKDSFYETDTSSDAKNSFFQTSQAVKNVIFDTNVPGKSSLLDPSIPSYSTKDFYGHYIPSSSKSNFYENSLPSTSRSNFYENYLPSTSKSNFYENSLPSTSRSNFYENSLPSTSRSNFYENYLPSTSTSNFYENSLPSTSKSNFYENSLPSTSRSNFYENSLPSTSRSNFYENYLPSTTTSNFYENSLPSTSKSNFYENSLPSTSRSNFYENSLPSTSKSVYNSECDVNNIFICEEMIPRSPTGISEEQYEQERNKALQTLYEEREAALAMCAMNQSFCRPMITLMGATEEEMEEYTNILKKDGAILDQQHLLYLAEISSKKLGINIKEPSVTEPLEREPETIVDKIAKPPEKPQFKRKIESDEETSKRSKLSAATAPIPSGINHFEESDEEEWDSLLAHPVFPPEMISAEKQTDLIDRLNDLRRVYTSVKARLVVTDRRKKKIYKRKRDQAKAARQAASGES